VGPARHHGPTAPPDAAADVRRQRRPYLDVVKFSVIVGVITGHAWAGYTARGAWPYSDVREVSLAPVSQAIAEAVLGPFGLFCMGLLFLVSGLVSAPSLRRKGPARFALDRIRRLGLPLLVFCFVLWPPVRIVLDHLAGGPGTPWWMPDPEQLWFLEVLMIFSAGAAAWWRYGPPAPDGSLTAGRLVLIGAAVAIGSFLIRLWFPLGSSGPGALHVCQWPQFVALFALGLTAGRRGWLDPVPERLRRECGGAAVAGVALIGALAAIAAVTGVPAGEFLGGPHWASLITSAAEGLLTVTVPLWLLGIAQQHFGRYRNAQRSARNAYAAFLIQGHVLIGLAVALRLVAVPAEVKAAVVAGAGVLLCFAIGGFLMNRTIVGHIL
jgi:acyltransferase-like protein